MTGERLAVATYELPRGAFVGKYEILRRLATGGMAEIYLARATGAHGFEKLVVLKRILPNVAEDPGFVSMFLDEARLAATLHHPNIADVYDVGADRGIYFYTMELVNGQDVGGIRRQTRKERQPLPLEVALAIVHGAATALEFAHEKTGADGQPLGLVHRDVSGSNIMVSYDGAVKLLDFGIARATTSSHKTRTGAIKGKIAYMSPEQCRSGAVDRRADLWSLGVVLYELTVGKKPFRGDSDFAIMDQIVNLGCTAPATELTEYPAALDAIVMKLLERDIEQRYQTCDALLQDLDAFIQENNLWMPQRQLGKYMRTMFAPQIQAWEQAQAEGASFDQLVAAVSSRDTGGSFEPVPGRDRIRAQSSTPVSMPGPAPIPEGDERTAISVTGFSAPRAQSRSRRALVIGGVATLVVAAGISVFVVTKGASGDRGTHVSAPPAVTAPSPIPAPPPPKPQAPPSPAPASAPPAASSAPTAEAAPAPAPVAAEPTPPEPIPSPEPPPVATRGAPVSSRPTGTKKQATTSRKSAPTPTVQPQPKEQPWDPNSPFLPGE